MKPRSRSFVVRGYAVAPYYPKGAEENDAHVRLQQLVYALKDGVPWQGKGGFQDPAEVVARYVLRYGCPVLDEDRVLVPMPRRTVTPRRVRVSRWPALKLARALCDVGLGADVVWGVRRETEIRSARENPRNRPTIEEHIETLEVRPERLPSEGTIVLVDDVVTRGTMFAAAVQMLRDAGWGGAIEAFAAAWTRRPDDGRGRPRVEMRIEWDDGDEFPRRLVTASSS